MKQLFYKVEGEQLSYLNRRLKKRLEDPEFRQEWERSEMTFPIEKDTTNGEEYINMYSDHFRLIFLTMMKSHSDVSDDVINKTDKTYVKARRIKRKRIRLKKEKQALLKMWGLMDNVFIK